MASTAKKRKAAAVARQPLLIPAAALLSVVAIAGTLWRPARPPVIPLQPAPAPAVAAAVTIPSALPVEAASAPGTTPPGDEVTPADIAPQLHDTAATSPVADAIPDGEAVLFLTIIGNQTWFHWGRRGDRPPRIDAATGQVSGVATAESLAAAPDSQVDSPPASDYGGEVRPYGPAPQECPRTLPSGSTQADADILRNLAGCRYLSSCTSEECTFHYQGRG